MKRSSWLSLAMIGAMTTTTWASDVVEESMRLVPDDAESPDYFAESIAVTDDWMIVGSPRHDEAAENAGAAYIYRYDPAACEAGCNPWQEETKLLPSLAWAQQRAGTAVAITSTHAFVGAPFARNGAALMAGLVYVFRYDPCEGNECSSWTLDTVLTAPTPIIGRQFGAALAAEGDRVVIGSSNGWYAPEAWVFGLRPDGTWELDATLLPDVGAATDFFGAAVALDGNRVVIGAPHAQDGGMAHVFSRAENGEWPLEDTLPATGVTAEAGFGAAVAVHRNTIVVGAPRDSQLGNESGKVITFGLIGGRWTAQARLHSPVAGDLARFGTAVAVRHEQLLVGAIGHIVPGANTGTVLSFQRDDAGQWGRRATIIPSEGTIGAQFGGAVALNAGHAVAGASWDSGARGAAYALQTLDASAELSLEAAVMAGPDLDGDGTVDVNDVAAVLLEWGSCSSPSCSTDLTGDGLTGVDDLLLVLSAWAGG